MVFMRALCLGCRRSDSCTKCRGPSGEDLSQGYYEAGGSFLKLGLVESFLVRRHPTPQQHSYHNLATLPRNRLHHPPGIPSLSLHHAVQVTVLADSAISFSAGYRKANDLGNRAQFLLAERLQHPTRISLPSACGQAKAKCPPAPRAVFAAGRMCLKQPAVARDVQPSCPLPDLCSRQGRGLGCGIPGEGALAPRPLRGRCAHSCDGFLPRSTEQLWDAAVLRQL